MEYRTFESIITESLYWIF